MCLHAQGVETSAITKSQDTQHLCLEKLPQITGNAADDSLFLNLK